MKGKINKLFLEEKERYTTEKGSPPDFVYVHPMTWRDILFGLDVSDLRRLRDEDKPLEIEGVVFKHDFSLRKNEFRFEVK